MCIHTHTMPFFIIYTQPDGFLGSLIGIRRDEARSFPIQFPESFEQESLRGVNAQFTVSVISNIFAVKLLPGCTTIDEVCILFLR